MNKRIGERQFRTQRNGAETVKPQLRDGLRVEIIGSEGALIHGEWDPVVLVGRFAEHLVPLLDGSLTDDEIADRLAAVAPTWQIRLELRYLRSSGCLAEDGEAPGSGPAAESDSLLESRSVMDVSQERNVELPPLAVAVVGELEPGVYLDALQRAGFETGEPGGVPLVLADSYLRTDLARANKARLDRGESWLLVRPAVRRVWLGPLFQPGRTACWRCLRDRLARNRPAEAWMLERRPEGGWLPGNEKPSESSQALAEALRAWIVERPVEELAGRLVERDSLMFQTVAHAVTRRPQCPACGSLDRATAPTSRPPPPAGPETLVDPLAGVVRRMIPLESGLEGPFHACLAPWGVEPLEETLASLASCLPRAIGKGWTADEARTRAIGEAVERYSAAFQGDEHRVTATACELGEEAIEPTACMLYSETQYASRNERNARLGGYHRIPEPFDVDAPLEWTRVEHLGGGSQRLLPTALLYSHYPPGRARSMLVSDPTGTAAERTREAAILNGLLEVIERDALGLWWYNAAPRPGIRFETDGPPWLVDLRATYRSIGRSFWLLDISTDIGVPCVAAISRRTEGPLEQILFGFGAHLDPMRAVRRALAELNQLMACVAHFRRAGKGLGTSLESWLRSASVHAEPHLAPLPSEYHDFGSLPTVPAATAAEGVEACRRLLEVRGLDVFVADMTRPDIGFRVFKAVVPGMRSMYARLAPGRLYDVPPAQGWLREPRNEATVNRLPFFL